MASWQDNEPRRWTWVDTVTLLAGAVIIFALLAYRVTW